MQGNEFNGLRSGSDLGTTRAVYKCWFGLELEPAESETRYCVQGKWTGENPQCGELVAFLYQRKKLIITNLLKNSDIKDINS